MKKVEYWMANDGTFFNSEKECRDYEMTPSADVKDGLRLLGKKFEPMLLSADEDWRGFALRISYASITNAPALNWMKQLSSTAKVPLPAKLGTFYWDAGYAQWICIEDLLDELAKIRRKLTE